MKLKFDRGTILLADAPADVDLATAPGVRWDPRVHAYRAPARKYASLKGWLVTAGVRFLDIASRPRPAPGAWTAVNLRPYQEAALSAWELGHRRGVLALPTGSGKTRIALAAMLQLRRGFRDSIPSSTIARRQGSYARATSPTSARDCSPLHGPSWLVDERAHHPELPTAQSARPDYPERLSSGRPRPFPGAPSQRQRDLDLTPSARAILTSVSSVMFWAGLVSIREMFGALIPVLAASCVWLMCAFLRSRANSVPIRSALSSSSIKARISGSPICFW